MRHFDISFKGYRRDCNKATLPDYSGIYIVYRCKYNTEDNTVTLNEIIYIGQALDLNQRLNKHEKYDSFTNECKQGEELCFSYAKVAKEDLDIVENAIVFAEKPRLNERLVDNYNHEDAQFNITGECALLKHKDYTIS